MSFVVCNCPGYRTPRINVNEFCFQLNITSVQKAFVGFHEKSVVHDTFAQAARNNSNNKKVSITTIHKPTGA